MQRLRFLLPLVVFSLASSLAVSPSVATLKKGIRVNYLAINELAQRGQLKVEQRHCAGSGPEFSLMTDRSGNVRRYLISGGTSDSAVTWQHDYDTAGRLTFVLVTYGNVHGGEAEWRLYFAPSGRLAELVRSGSTALVSDELLWTFITREPALDWKTNWCP